MKATQASGEPRSRRLAAQGALALCALFATCSGPPPADHRSIGLRHAAAAEHAFRVGRHGAASHSFSEAIRHLRAADDQPAVARVLHNFGVALAAWQRCDLALGHLRESAALQARGGEAGARASTALALAACHATLGDPVRAAQHLQQASQLARKGHPALAARALAGLGAMKAEAGDLTAAEQHYQQAEQLAGGARDPGATALVHNNRGRLLMRRGQTAGARQRFETAARLYRQAGDPRGLSQALANQAETLATASGTHAEAAALYQRAAHAALAATRYLEAATHFAAAAQQFARAQEPGLAERCREHGRKALDAARLGAR